MNDKFLLTAATLAGIAAGSIGTASLTARAGVVEHKLATGTVVLAQATAASMTLTQLAAAGCAEINEDLGLTGDDVCSLSKVKQVHAYRDDAEHPGEIVVVVLAEIHGTWVAGSAE